MANQSP